MMAGVKLKQAITNTDEINGATGNAALEMMAIATFTDTATQGLESPWIIAAVIPGEADAYPWSILDGQTYPFLSWKSVG
jgi:hypothetical protein